MGARRAGVGVCLRTRARRCGPGARRRPCVWGACRTHPIAYTRSSQARPTISFLRGRTCARAYVEDSRIQQWKLRGDRAAEQCLHAISFVLRGLDVATSDSGMGAPDRKKYSFLVCNASVAWWRVSRPLRVAVLMAKLVPSLEKLLPELKAAHDNLDETTRDPAWLAQLFICQGQCLLDAGEASAAQSAAGAALPYCKDSPNLMERAYRLQIHAGGKAALPANLKVAGTLQEIASGILVNDEKNPDAVANALLEALNDPHADPVLYSALKENPGDSHQTLVMANEEDEKNKKKPSQECLDIVVEIGRAAIYAGCAKVAEVCALRGKLAKSLRSRVLCHYINAGLAINALGEEKERYTRRMVAVRLDVLSQLERALQSAERLPEDELAVVQEGCVLVWNVAQPSAAAQSAGAADGSARPIPGVQSFGRSRLVPARTAGDTSGGSLAQHSTRISFRARRQV
eukprot:20309_6